MGGDRFDEAGKALRKGDTVRVKRIPENLPRGLPVEDQSAIRACVGRVFSISGFNDNNEAEIEFTDEANDYHTIWIPTNCLEKTS